MHIKLNFVGAFMGVPCDENSTAGDIIDFILDHNEVPLEYAALCAILEIRADNFGYPLSPNEPIVRFENAKNALHFRVLSIPTAMKAETLHPNFQELLHNQIHRLIVTRTWACPDDWVYKFAAYRCGIEFGDFNPSSHKIGFFTKTLQQMVPADVIASFKQKEIEQEILLEWSVLTAQKKTSPHQTAVMNYLKSCQEQVRQYGCATFVARLTQIDDEPQDLYVYFGLRMEGYLILDPDGNETASFSYKSAKIDWPADDDQDLTITSQGVTYKMEMNGIKAMKSVGEFLMQAKLPE
ncbi:Conserved_hypothetical protein [Hexamita inflata]|uniref:FERM domain-containing protein n=1 Tax=Hexamita inflata TaxID=28002 RepID=A0AA86P732_9EUKA|nr:Conserved hypothetical protein [Hexamita inflata]CAI9941104.1 Conserved hypothetical protein [Hexamita inflata]